MASENPRFRESSGEWQVHVGSATENYANVVGIDVSIWARPTTDSNPRCYFYEDVGDSSNKKRVKEVHPYFANTFQKHLWRSLCNFLVAQGRMEAALLDGMEPVIGAGKAKKAKRK